MVFAIPIEEQGRMQIIAGYASNVNTSSRSGGKDKPKVPCVFCTVMAMGCEPINVRADVKKYGSEEANPVANDLARVPDGSHVLIVGRNVKRGDFESFEVQRVFTDEKVFAYFGILTGRTSMPK